VGDGVTGGDVAEGGPQMAKFGVADSGGLVDGINGSAYGAVKVRISLPFRT
jgi:hypothetical protein